MHSASFISNHDILSNCQALKTNSIKVSLLWAVSTHVYTILLLSYIHKITGLSQIVEIWTTRSKCCVLLCLCIKMKIDTLYGMTLLLKITFLHFNNSVICNCQLIIASESEASLASIMTIIRHLLPSQKVVIKPMFYRAEHLTKFPLQCTSNTK